MVTGGIAAFRAPDLVRALRKAGAEVFCYATPEALRFVTRDTLEWCSTHPLVVELDGKAQHVEDARKIDAWLVAPATYSTLNKTAWGIADNALTAALAVALGRVEQGRGALLVAPTMHGAMVNGLLRESLARLAGQGAVVIPPRPGAGKANLPEVGALVRWVARAISSGCLEGRNIAVTLGQMHGIGDGPDGESLVYDGVVGHSVIETLWREGANVQVVVGPGVQLSYPERYEVHRTTTVAEMSEALEALMADSPDALVLAHRGESASTTAQWADRGPVLVAIQVGKSEEWAQSMRSKGAGYAASCPVCPGQGPQDPFEEPVALLGSGGEESETPRAFAEALCRALSTAMQLL